MDDVFFVNVDAFGGILFYQLLCVDRNISMSLLELCPCPYNWSDPAADLMRIFRHVASVGVSVQESEIAVSYEDGYPEGDAKA